MSSIKNPTLRRRTKELTECAEDARECQLLAYELRDIGRLIEGMVIHIGDLQRKVDGQAEHIKMLNEKLTADTPQGGKERVMISLRMTDKRKDIGEWTGLTDDELWEVGFDLDDWDVCFESDKRLVIKFEDWETPRKDAEWLVRTMDNYCCGYNEVECGGRWYYTVHHA